MSSSLMKVVGHQMPGQIPSHPNHLIVPFTIIPLVRWAQIFLSANNVLSISNSYTYSMLTIFVIFFATITFASIALPKQLSEIPQQLWFKSFMSACHQQTTIIGFPVTPSNLFPLVPLYSTPRPLEDGGVAYKFECEMADQKRKYAAIIHVLFGAVEGKPSFSVMFEASIEEKGFVRISTNGHGSIKIESELSS